MYACVLCVCPVSLLACVYVCVCRFGFFLLPGLFSFALSINNNHVTLLHNVIRVLLLRLLFLFFYKVVFTDLAGRLI
uniref:Uncharacterized protein n=1 Tax=Anopheles darlingi TaxID=43151 RepID=A0A2M4DD03_ANODA